MPSSLTRVLPRTLGFSPRIPVSVYGTGGSFLTRSFSRQRRLNPFGNKFPPHHASASVHGFACAPACTLVRDLPFSRGPAFLRHSIVQTIAAGTGISTSCPSPTLHASDSVPTYPETTIVAQESLCFRWIGFSPIFSLLMPTFSLPTSPPSLPGRLQPNGNAPLPRGTSTASVASVPYFSPGNLRRRASRPVSYYALFKWWLLLSQHPGCL